MFTSSSAGLPSAGDLAWHAPVRGATTAALPANTYAAGAPSTLTANANGVFPTQDGQVGQAAGDRILVKDEALLAHNGIYVITVLGTAGTPWVLSRAADADTAAEMPQGSVVYVRGGIDHPQRYFVLRTQVADIDATGETWTELNYLTQVITRVILATGTWIHPTDSTFYGARVRLVGGGGAGGGAVVTAAGQGACGAGGGGGGYAESWRTLAALSGGNQAVVVGAGGVAVVGAAGGAGGASSFGLSPAANGGAGGGVTIAAAGNASFGGSDGGAGTAGDIQIPGGGGGAGNVFAAFGGSTGTGGDSVLASVRRAATVNLAGLVGNQYGGGGSGANNGAAQAARAGGNGAAGVVIVDEYYSG